MSRALRNGLLGRAAITVSLLTLLSSAFGFAREVINASAFGAGGGMDAFVAAAAVPLLGASVLSAAIAGAIIPTLSSAYALENNRSSASIATTLVAVSMLFFAVIAAVLSIFAPFYVSVLFPGFTGERLTQTIEMTRLLMLTILPSGVASVLAAIINAKKRFIYPALQPFALNCVTIIAVLIASRWSGIWSLVLGTVVGISVQPALLIPGLRGTGVFAGAIRIRSAAMRQIWMAILPLLISAATAQIALVLDRYFGSMLGNGVVSELGYVQRLTSVPQQLIATALGTVMFPVIAQQYALRDYAATSEYLRRSIQSVFFLTIPVCITFWLYSEQTITIVFKHGAFGNFAAHQSALFLPYSALTLIPISLNIILVRSAWAAQRMSIAVGVSVATAALNAILSMLLLPHWGARGLLCANFLSQLAQAIVLFNVLHSCLGGIRLRPLLSSSLKSCLAGCCMILSILMVRQMFPGGMASAAAGCTLGVSAFIVIAALLRSEDVQQLYTAQGWLLNIAKDIRAA